MRQYPAAKKRKQSKLMDLYWNPSKAPKDKRLALSSAQKQHRLAHKANSRGLKY